jgi:hypothetical protein
MNTSIINIQQFYRELEEVITNKPGFMGGLLRWESGFISSFTNRYIFYLICNSYPMIIDHDDEKGFQTWVVGDQELACHRCRSNIVFFAEREMAGGLKSAVNIKSDAGWNRWSRTLMIRDYETKWVLGIQYATGTDSNNAVKIGEGVRSILYSLVLFAIETRAHWVYFIVHQLDNSAPVNICLIGSYLWK